MNSNRWKKEEDKKTFDKWYNIGKKLRKQFEENKTEFNINTFETLGNTLADGIKNFANYLPDLLNTFMDAINNLIEFSNEIDGDEKKLITEKELQEEIEFGSLFDDDALDDDEIDDEEFYDIFKED